MSTTTTPARAREHFIRVCESMIRMAKKDDRPLGSLIRLSFILMGSLATNHISDEEKTAELGFWVHRYHRFTTDQRRN